MVRWAAVLLVLSAVALGLPSAGAATTTADVSVTVARTPSPVDAGAQLTYAITVANAATSPDTANNVDVAAALPGGTSFVSVPQTSGPGFRLNQPDVIASGGILAPGESARFVYVLRVNSNASAG